jgi:hypothetical protein
MPQMTQRDLRYTYNWTVSPGDNAKLIGTDRQHLSRKEGYEMLVFLNGLKGANGADLTVRTRQIVEWMLKEHYSSTAPSRETVGQWVAANFKRLAPGYPA